MIQRYNTDRWADVRQLLRRGPKTADGGPQCLGRRTLCGTATAESWGMVPVLDYPDKLINWKDAKEIINYCNEQKIFPKYHLQASGVCPRPGDWDQDGWGYCWAFGGTSSLMMCRELEGKSRVKLNPFSLGWLVNWRNSGYYVDATMRGMRERGVASFDTAPVLSPSPSKFKSNWEQDALNYRASEYWDTRYTSEIEMLRQVLTVLRTGVPGSIAYNWWGHALSLVGMQWDESERNNVVVEVFNSHADGVIELTGSRAVPDVFIGLRAASLAGD